MKLNAAIFMCICCLFATIQTEAQHWQQVELTSSMDQFTLQEGSDGLVSIIAHEQDYHYPQGINAPALPLITVSVLVPPGAKLENYSCSVERVTERVNVQLARAAVPVPISQMDKYEPGPRQYKGSFPEKTVSYVTTMIQRGYTWFSFDYSPFEYDAESGNLTHARKLVLDLEYRVLPEGILIHRPDPALVEHIKERIVNPDDLDRFYPEGQDYGFQLKSSQDRVDYLIITSEALKPAFKPLMEWKTRKGLRTHLVTMEEISENYDDPSIQLKLKRCLYDYYRDHGLTWVLLGGDAEIVPVQGCYSTARTEADIPIEDWSIPTDLFYACFDMRFDWNSYVDDRIGQLNWDGHDMNPEVYISRVPLKTSQQVEAFVSKTIRYEKDPPLEDFFGKMLLSGVRFWNIWDGKSDSHHRSENFYNNDIKYLWKGEKVGFYDTGTDLLEGSPHEVTDENLSMKLNSGYGFFHFSGHGNINSLLMETGDAFDSDDAMGLVNPVPGIVLANSCDVNAFDSINPCLSEAFLRNPVGGAIAFFGSSRFGFDNAEASGDLGPSFKLNASFAKYLFGNSPLSKWKSFAAIAAMAKSDFVHSGSSGGAHNYLQYSVNPIGDPELPLYAYDPRVFDRVRIYQLGNELTVNTGGIMNGRICLTSLDLEEGYQQVVENMSFHTFQEIPGSFQVTLTAPGYRPYIYRTAGITSLEENPDININVYPVPAREYLIIELGEPTAVVKLCDLNGRVLLDMIVNRGQNQLDISEFPEGIYILKIISGSGRKITRVAKL
ncbi:C25 family cysteine peptidase [Bacteroidota bacterium]